MAIEQLIGAWNLVSWCEIKSDGTAHVPPDDIGKLIYTADGHVSAQIARRHPGRLQNDDWRRASDAEIRTAWESYFGYFGTYTVDSERALITHHVEGAYFPNLVGTDQVRRYRFEDSRLILEANTAWGSIRAIWERAAATSREPVP